jgi:excisionase family DNA binding protein
VEVPLRAEAAAAVLADRRRGPSGAHRTAETVGERWPRLQGRCARGPLRRDRRRARPADVGGALRRRWRQLGRGHYEGGKGPGARGGHHRPARARRLRPARRCRRDGRSVGRTGPRRGPGPTDRPTPPTRTGATHERPDLGAAILASLDENTLRALAERLRPYLEDRPDHQPLLTPAQAAKRLAIHPKTVVRMARDGRLPAVKIGTGWRFHTDQLDIAPPIRPLVGEPPCHSPASARER